MIDLLEITYQKIIDYYLKKVREGTKVLGDYSDEFGRSEELESEYKKIL